MMDGTYQPPAPKAPAHLTKIPIAQLSPTLNHPEDKCIYAAVTLVWPYSSSTRSISLLLAEPDFRLRRSNGQVKATFHGRVAEKVAESQVGIGDDVRLSLNGLRLVANEVAKQTPARNVAWDAHFDNSVLLEIYRSLKLVSTVSHEQRAPALQETELALPTSPGWISAPVDADVAPGPGSWGSPAFLQSSRTSFGGAIGSAFDPFAEEDGFVPGKGRKRPRYSLRRDEWRVVDEPDSPRELEGTVDWEEAFDEDRNNEPEYEETRTDAQPDHELPISDTAKNLPNTADVSGEEPHVFVKPSAELTGSILEKRAEQSLGQLPDRGSAEPFASTGIDGQQLHAGPFRLPTDTPLLCPVPSPGLPIPSPLISNTNSPRGYFAPVLTNPEAQDIQYAPAEISARSVTEMRSTTYMPTSSVHSQVHTAFEDVERAQREHRGMTGPSPYPSIPGSTSGFPEDFSTKVDHEGHVDLPKTTDDLKAAATGMDIEDVDDGVHGLGETEEAVYQFLTEPSTEGAEVSTSMAMESIRERDSSPIEQVSEAERQVREHTPENYGRTEGYPAADSMDEDEDELEDEERERQTIEAYSRQHSRSLSEEDSFAEGVDVDDVADDSESHGDYEHEAKFDGSEVESEDISDEEPEQERGPVRRQPPEVIVLDSDSDNELASDQPMPPPPRPASEVGRSRRRLWLRSSATEDPALDENEETWSVEEEERSDSDRMEEYLDQDDRALHDQSDEESSVDELAQDFYKSELPIREASSVRVQDDSEMAGAEPIESSADERHSKHSIEVEPQAKQAVYLRPLGQRLGELAQPEPGVPYQDETYGRWSASMNQPDFGTLLDRSHSLDAAIHSVAPESPALAGVADVQMGREEGMQDSGAFLEEFGHELKPDQQVDFSYSVDGAGSSRMERVARMPSVSPEHQLLTPDPAQEAAFDHSLTTADGRPEISATLDGMPETPAGLNLPSQPLPDIAIVVPEPAQEFTPSAQTDVFGLELVPITEAEDAADGDMPATEPADTIGDEVVQDLTTGDGTYEVSALPIPQPAVPDRHALGLRSKLSYFAPLATLIDHYNALVDTVSIVHETSPVARATAGSKDYFMTIQLTDPSMAGTTLNAQIFRANKSAMPSLAEGSAILLRDFKVKSYDHAIMLVSVESSAWAVFDGSGPDAQMSGPPVEYGAEERAYASGLRRWYQEVGLAMVADNQLQASIETDSMVREPSPRSVVPSEPGSLDSFSREGRRDSAQSGRGSRRRRTSHRRVTIHELRDGTRYTEIGSPSQSSIHELRDGTVYATL